MRNSMTIYRPEEDGTAHHGALVQSLMWSQTMTTSDVYIHYAMHRNLTMPIGLGFFFLILI
jgi:hypothetical protein